MVEPSDRLYRSVATTAVLGCVCIVAMSGCGTIGFPDDPTRASASGAGLEPNWGSVYESFEAIRVHARAPFELHERGDFAQAVASAESCASKSEDEATVRACGALRDAALLLAPDIKSLCQNSKNDAGTSRGEPASLCDSVRAAESTAPIVAMDLPREPQPRLRNDPRPIMEYRGSTFLIDTGSTIGGLGPVSGSTPVRFDHRIEYVSALGKRISGAVVVGRRGAYPLRFYAADSQTTHIVGLADLIERGGVVWDEMSVGLGTADQGTINGAKVVSLRFQFGAIAFKAAIDSRPIDVCIDTGATVTLARKNVLAHALSIGYRANQVALRFASDAPATNAWAIPGLEIAHGATALNLGVTYVPHDGNIGLPCDIALGGDFFSAFRRTEIRLGMLPPALILSGQSRL